MSDGRLDSEYDFEVRNVLRVGSSGETFRVTSVSSTTTYFDLTARWMREGFDPCRVYWGSHGCDLPRGHDGPHDCGCCDCEDHERDHVAEGCVSKPPYYGSDTNFYGEDVEGS